MKGGQGCFICGGDHFARECSNGGGSGPRQGKGAGGKRSGKGKGGKVGGTRSGKGSGRTLDPEKLSHPVDDDGEWVLRDDFTGRKSFGYFQCNCAKEWQSAHAYKEFNQDCQSCETGSLPLFMWRNFTRRAGYHEEESERSDLGHHDSERCGACRAGVCSFREGASFS